MQIPLRMQKKKNIPAPTYFGQNLRYLRRKYAMSQSLLAEKLHCTRGHIASYESGFVEPKALMLLKVCAFFSIDPRIILSSLLSANPAFLKGAGGPPDSTSNDIRYYVNQLKNETDAFAKIVKGYQVFYDLRKSQPGEENLQSTYNIYEDLLQLMDILVEGNQSFLDDTHTSSERNE